MSLIRVKRSGSTGSPSALAQGEMAYSFLGGSQSNGGDRLYIGTGTESGGVAANIEVIGGKYFTAKLAHVPGTLTANAAVIVDASGKIDTFNATALTANTFTVTGSLTANGSTGTAGQVLTSNSSGIYWSTSAASGATDIGQSSNSSTISLTSTSGSGTVLGAANTIKAGLLSADAQTIAGVKTFTTTIIGSISGDANNASYLGGTAASGYQTTAGLSANVATLTANNSDYLGGTAASGYQTTAGLSANVATLASNSATFANGSASNTFTVGTGSYFVANGNVGVGNSAPVDKLSVNGTSYFGGNLRTTGSIQIDGNLTVSGTTVTINATNLAVEDNMIYLNEGSAVTNPDLGIAGNYNDGTYAHAGVFRDATDGVWKFYHGYVPEPDTYVDITHATFALSTVQANTFIGALTGTATSANNASYLGGTAASGYQTTAGLSANVATLTSNNASYFNGQTASYYANASNISTGTLALARLAASTISGISLGSNLGTLTFGAGLTAGGSAYDGSTGVTITPVTATTSTKGIASFDSTNFTVTSGAVALTSIDGGTY